MNLLHQVRALFEPVLAELAPDRAKVPDYLAMVKPAASAEHGDYQANFAMPLEKALGRKAPDVAKEIIAKLLANRDREGAGVIVELPTVAGRGFINLRVK